VVPRRERGAITLAAAAVGIAVLRSVTSSGGADLRLNKIEGLSWWQSSAFLASSLPALRKIHHGRDRSTSPVATTRLERES
jgi:hypothetical protein